MIGAARGRRAGRHGVKVSVIVAVYNPGGDIDDLLESLTFQTLGPTEMEVIFVDDGSTDGTAERMESLARSRANWIFLAIPNSGWPGRPRNVGLDRARGEFVLFADNDDLIPRDALRLMYEYAKECASDVVIGREVGRGRVVDKSIFERSVPDAVLGVDPLLRALTPHKLYRRSLLDTHQIRFPEGVFRLEDHLFNITTYFAARRISIYAQQPCYIWTKRRDASGLTNASYNEWSPHDYYGTNLDQILAVVEQNTEPGELRDYLYGQWFERMMLSRLTDGRFVKYTPERRLEMYDAIRSLTLKRIGTSADQFVPVRMRLRSALLRMDRYEWLLPLAEAESGVHARVETSGLRWVDGVAEVDVFTTMHYADGREVAFERIDDRFFHVPALPAVTDLVDRAVRSVDRDLHGAHFALLVRQRAEPEAYIAPIEGHVRLELLADSNTYRLVAEGTARVDVIRALAGRPPQGTVDFSIWLAFGGWSLVRRVPAPSGSHLAEVLRGARIGRLDPALYVTDKGNVSLRVSMDANGLREDISQLHVVRAEAQRILLTAPISVAAGDHLLLHLRRQDGYRVVWNLRGDAPDSARWEATSSAPLKYGTYTLEVEGTGGSGNVPLRDSIACTLFGVRFRDPEHPMTLGEKATTWAGRTRRAVRRLRPRADRR